MYVTDLADFAGVETTTQQRFAAARRFAAFAGAIAGAGTASPAGPLHPTPLACRRRPGHRPCRGFLLVRRSESPPQIEWACPVCADEGLLYGWEGSIWDLSPPRETHPDDACAWLDPDQYRLLLTLPLDRDARRVVHAARLTGGGVLLSAREEELSSIVEWVAGEANRRETPRRQRALDELVEAIEAYGPGGGTPQARRQRSGPQPERQAARRGSTQHPAAPDRARRSVHQLKVTLRDIQPPVWRRVQVPSDITLAQLHEVIQIAFGWEDDHLHDFEAGDQRSGVHPEDSGPVGDERRVTLGGIAPRPGDRLDYRYDFGDSWIHRILVEAVLPAPAGPRLAVCLGGRRACPPEDCGGPWGYAELLAAIADEDHPEHEEMMELAGPLDPERFSAQEVTARLRRFPL